ncbi:glycerol-3-phosphate dehydrogenase/oxidase [soil metagenome]
MVAGGSPGQPPESCDLVVIGGGIHGAAAAWEAASRGVRTVVLEARDFGGATSANSLRTIHGGIRYLQTLDVARMRTAVRERRALLRIAPHLVRPLECVMPTYRGSGKSAPALRAGLLLNDLLSADRNSSLASERRIPAGSMMSAQSLAAKAPALRDDRITGGARWFDAQAHDTERLVLSFVLSAVRAGAWASNHCPVTGLIIEDGRVAGVCAEDRRSGEPVEIRAGAVVDCTGPWAGRHEWRAQFGGRWARGMNLVLRRPVADCALGVLPAAGTTGANRLLFIAPWRDGCIAGTWYERDDGDPRELRVEAAAVEGALAQLDSVLPELRLGLRDVTQVHLGVLPATGEEAHGEPVLESHPRIEAATDGPRGLYVVCGVKYTTARHVAECTIDRLAQNGLIHAGASVSARVPLYGGNFPAGPDAWRQVCHERYGARLPAATLSRLADHYGTRLDRIMELAERDPSLAAEVPGCPQAVCAELEHAVADEMAWTLGDVLQRRTGIASCALPNDRTIASVADFMAARLGWDDARRSAEINALREAFPPWAETR